jgi:iron complex transport system substrate-binding protein
LYELKVQDNLYGVTHECKYPIDAKSKLQIIDSVINSDKLTSKEIDTKTCQLLKDGKDIFVLNEENLKKADPDLIISQETCEVCAAYTNQVKKAIEILQKKPILHSIDPHNIHEIVKSVTTLGKILEKQDKAKEIVSSLEERIQNIEKHQNNEKPNIVAIEWVEPFFTAGHWIPEMIEIAGGINMISKTGEHSRRLEFDEISKADPDIIIMMPCGFDTKRTILEYNQILKENKQWNNLKAVRNKNVFAVDANSFFSKPSIRTIEGLEILAKIIQPEKFKELMVTEKSFARIN